MLKRLKMWSFVAATLGVSALSMGCDAWWPYNNDASSIARIVTAILREDIFS